MFSFFGAVKGRWFFFQTFIDNEAIGSSGTFCQAGCVDTSMMTVIAGNCKILDIAWDYSIASGNHNLYRD